MVRLIAKILGTSLSWRLGRALYLAARGEGANDMETNGERLLVERMARISAREGRSQSAISIVDCGANLGDWTAMTRRAFAASGTSVHYHLMEPAPATFASTSRRFADDSAVTVHPIALSDREGSADFYLVEPTGGRNSLVDSEHSEAERIRVRVARGSDYFANQGVARITLLKIDTEGNDYAVIEGFEEMLRDHRILVVQFEYNFRWLAAHRSLRDIFQLAERHGYRVGRANGEKIVAYAGWNAELDRFFEWNYLLMTPDMAELLGARESGWSASNTLVDAPER